jgi:uncharacterized protein YcfJ
MLSFYSGCSKKASNILSENRKNTANETEIESFETGVLIGSFIGHVSGSSVVTSTVVGAVAGLTGGNLLSKMQKSYQKKEHSLNEKILKSVQIQQQLSLKIIELNINVSKLDKDTEALKSYGSKEILESKNKISQKILLKKEELLSFKQLNDSAIDDILLYNNLVSYTQYTKERKKEVEGTLDNVLTNLFHLRKTCNENLEKLNNLEERL